MGKVPLQININQLEAMLSVAFRVNQKGITLEKNKNQQIIMQLQKKYNLTEERPFKLNNIVFS